MNINPTIEASPPEKKVTCCYYTCVYHACMSNDCQRSIVFDQVIYLGPSICAVAKDLPGDVFLFVRKRKLRVRISLIKDVENFRYEYYLNKEGYSREFKICGFDVLWLVYKKYISKFAYEFL